MKQTIEYTFYFITGPDSNHVRFSFGHWTSHALPSEEDVLKVPFGKEQLLVSAGQMLGKSSIPQMRGLTISSLLGP